MAVWDLMAVEIFFISPKRQQTAQEETGDFRPEVDENGKTAGPGQSILVCLWQTLNPRSINGVIECVPADQSTSEKSLGLL